MHDSDMALEICVAGETALVSCTGVVEAEVAGVGGCWICNGGLLRCGGLDCGRGLLRY